MQSAQPLTDQHFKCIIKLQFIFFAPHIIIFFLDLFWKAVLSDDLISFITEFVFEAFSFNLV